MSDPLVPLKSSKVHGIEIKEGEAGEIIVELDLFAMSILATLDNGETTDIQHMATATNTSTAEEAESAAYQIAEQIWPKSAGWKHDVAVVKVPIKARTRLMGIRRPDKPQNNPQN